MVIRKLNDDNLSGKIKVKNDFVLFQSPQRGLSPEVKEGKRILS
jgi:hypothetical protein